MSGIETRLQIESRFQRLSCGQSNTWGVAPG
jgi:hypothetical protein